MVPESDASDENGSSDPCSDYDEAVESGDGDVTPALVETDNSGTVRVLDCDGE